MADFLTDYSGIAAAGSAFKGFAEGFEQAQDKQMKRLQSAAELEALHTKIKRDSETNALTAYKEHAEVRPDGSVGPRENTPQEQENIEAQRMEKGVRKNPDTNALEWDPNSPQVMKAKAFGQVTPAMLFKTHNDMLNKGYKMTGTDPDTGMPTYTIDQTSLAAQKVTNQKDANTSRIAIAKQGAQRQDKRLDLMENRFGEVQDQNAIKAGKGIDTDHIVTDLTSSRQSLSRGRNLLNGDMPLTYKNLGAVQQDIINAITKGGVSSEGKVNREMQDSWTGTWNNLLAKAGKYGPDNDIRKQDPGLYKQLQSFLEEVDGSVAANLSERVKTLSGSYSQTSNQKTKKIIEDKVKGYSPAEKPQGLVQSKGLVGQEGLVKGGAPDPKITKFAADNKIDYAAAQALLKARGYGR